MSGIRETLAADARLEIRLGVPASRQVNRHHSSLYETILQILEMTILVCRRQGLGGSGRTLLA